MLIVADSNIPCAAEAFAQFGQVRALSSDELTAESVRDAEVLLVRSTIKVDAALLEGASPRFVGTATIGTDHVDLDYLAGRGIHFASAPGSNADSVAEYWSSAVLLLAARLGWELAERTVGIVGVGNVGRRIVRRARALGMKVLKCDPPLGRETGSDEYRPLEELLEASDIITLHVPLTREGQDPTFHMAGAKFFERLKPGAVFVNTARGKVHDTAALLEAVEAEKLSAAVIDVWEGEPVAEAELLERADIGTPHIAGHSLDGKVNGTYMLYREVCRMLGIREEWKPADSLPPPEVPRLELEASAFDAQLTATEAALSLYQVAEDDAALRKTLAMPGAERGAYFAKLRAEYPVRRGFQNTTVVCKGGTMEQRRALAGLGFKVV